MATERKPSRYVSLYMARGTAEAALAALRWNAEGRGKRHPLWRAVKQLEEALAVGLDTTEEPDA